MSNEVETLLTEKGIPFNFSGHDLLIRCLNPEHPDKNPSLRVDKLTGMLHCFSCGFKGNIFKHFGIVQNMQSAEVMRLKNKIQAVFAESIGLEMPFGYSLFDKPFRGISAETLKKYEAFTHKDFENRIVFPIKDGLGKIKVFIGRHMFSNVGKRYDIKPSGIPVPFFPHNPPIINGSLILVEGIFDALNLIDKGVSNVISVMGTQGITPGNAGVKLSNYKLMGCTKIYLLFDGDAPGRKAAADLEPVINKLGFFCKKIDLDEDADPGIMDEDDIKQLRKLMV
jgi:DNA primase